jgi:hypothetical protein
MKRVSKKAPPEIRALADLYAMHKKARGHAERQLAALGWAMPDEGETFPLDRGFCRGRHCQQRRIATAYGRAGAGADRSRKRRRLSRSRPSLRLSVQPGA